MSPPAQIVETQSSSHGAVDGAYFAVTGSLQRFLCDPPDVDDGAHAAAPPARHFA